MSSVAIPASAVGAGRVYYPSEPQATVVLPAVAADISLPSVTVPATPIPSGASVFKVFAAVQWRKQVDSSGSENALNGAQVIQIRLSGAAIWTSCIDMVDNSLNTAASATEGGPYVSGDVDLSAIVTGAGQYDFQWADALVDGASLTLYDLQCVILIYYN